MITGQGHARRSLLLAPRGDLASAARLSRRELLRLGAGITCTLGAATLLSGCGRAATPTAGIARAPLIGYLDLRSSDAAFADLDAFRDELRSLGYVEGETIAIEYRHAGGDDSRLIDLANELVALNADVIVAFGTQASLRARDVAEATPIVMAITSDPVGTRLVESLARPGGTVTGSTSSAPQLAGKRLELLKELAPTASRVGVLWNSDNPGDRGEWETSGHVAQRLGLDLVSLEVTAPGQIAGAFNKARAERVQALVAAASSVLIDQRSAIVSLAAAGRLPAIYAQREFVEIGGLMSYGPDYRALFRRAAVFVDKILKGARPADLPVEKAQRFTLAVSLRAAQSLGLTIPRSLRVQVDEVL